MRHRQLPARARTLIWIVGGIVLVALATAVDPWAYHHLVWTKVYETDWGRALRTVGYWPTWIVVAFALWLDGPRRQFGAWQARVLAISVTAAGILGEICKMLLRRERPNAHDGAYVFRAFTDRPFNTSGIGLPSSHAFLAFAAAGILARLFPRTAAMWYGLAAGCAATRVLSQAHFMSDVAVGALLGLAVAHLTVSALPAPGAAHSTTPSRP